MAYLEEFIASGILELYAAGLTSPEENAAVQQMVSLHPAVADEINSITAALQHYADSMAIAPNPAVKAFLLATIDYTERISNGEEVSFPPEIHNNSTIADYSKWLDLADMQAPAAMPLLYARIIGYTETMTTAIAWIKEMAPQEVHDNEIEKFLIVEGSCDITIGSTVHHLVAGDVLSIPLHEHHFVQVTSPVPCKVILQRIAA
ncbi:cupin domain-containing protein [Ferruginibacter sp.]